RTARNTRVTNRDIISENPFRFSSEVHDDALALVYYNYRHYSPTIGRWCGRDPIGNFFCKGLYVISKNHRGNHFDWLGLVDPDFVEPFKGLPSECDILGKTRRLPTENIKVLEREYTGESNPFEAIFGALIYSRCKCKVLIKRQRLYQNQTCVKKGFCSFSTPAGEVFLPRYVWEDTSESWESMPNEAIWESQGRGDTSIFDTQDNFIAFSSIIMASGDINEKCRMTCLLKHNGGRQ
ncbi:MAG: RHS repeat-associated core domain-containing protein, partial [Kiritimatiellia bacterium]